MAACVEPAAAARHPTAAAKTGLKRKRIAVGSTELYEFDETSRLGAGAFGAVFKARHRATGQTVAMKRHSTADSGHATLLRESRFLEDACCGGANLFVVGFHGVVRDPVTWEMCLVMECVATSLHDLLRQRPRGRPPLPEATHTAVVLVDAIRHRGDAGAGHAAIQPPARSVPRDEAVHGRIRGAQWLLTCNPDKSLTAAAALKHPWFAKVDGLELRKKEKPASTLPKPHKRQRLRAVCVT
ncbi:unnamed protein product [Miscanthus lutarioriparius]|uniref:[RNA-polymerase]-subunit kinase n=1 Tax=Miscanthus lutarioriparius TaxID=422564 RepID=A0A811MGK7_9POAL|nr:unnamed protein product [Miscanthus lutarioriparius]